MLLCKSGTYLGGRSLQGAKVSLYLLNNTLVEVFYSYMEGTVEDIKMTSSQSLEDYHVFLKTGLA